MVIGVVSIGGGMVKKDLSDTLIGEKAACPITCWNPLLSQLLEAKRTPSPKKPDPRFTVKR